MANSTPIVDFDSKLNSFLVNRDRRLLFPTPESPINTTESEEIELRILMRTFSTLQSKCEGRHIFCKCILHPLYIVTQMNDELFFFVRGVKAINITLTVWKTSSSCNAFVSIFDITTQDEKFTDKKILAVPAWSWRSFN